MLPFVKMHGAGNDYIYIDCFAQPVPNQPEELARRLSERHTGVGGDGIVLVIPPTHPQADARMRMFNADGTESEMCGNATRCVAKLLYDRGIVPKEQMTLETGRGLLRMELREIINGQVRQVCVDMGEPVFLPGLIPTTLGNPGAGDVVDVPFRMADAELKVTCLSMGNPHCVTFVEELNDDWVLRIGPNIETAAEFPRRVNAEFVQILSTTELLMRVWERGTGETQACGTGACAAVVAGVLNGKIKRTVIVHLPGGDLEIEWRQADNHVYKTGPAVEVFRGVWP